MHMHSPRVGREGKCLNDLGDLFAADDLICLRAFLSLHDVEFDIVSFFQAFISVNLNGAVVDEDIRSVIPPNKTVSLCIVEPLDLAFVLSHELLTFLTADSGWGLTNLPTVETQLAPLWFSLKITGRSLEDTKV